MVAVVRYEMGRRRDVAALFAGLGAALLLGAWPGALVALACVAVASWLLRARA